MAPTHKTPPDTVGISWCRCSAVRQTDGGRGNESGKNDAAGENQKETKVLRCRHRDTKFRLSFLVLLPYFGGSICVSAGRLFSSFPFLLRSRRSWPIYR